MNCLCVKSPDLRFSEGWVYTYGGLYMSKNRESFFEVGTAILNSDTVDDSFIILDEVDEDKQLFKLALQYGFVINR